MEEFEINESQFLDENCYDVILSNDENINEYLEEDKDSILIIIKKRDKYLIDCYKGEYLQNILDDSTKGRYPCLKTNKNTNLPIPEDPLNVLGFVETNNLFYRIDLSFGGFYLSKKDIKSMITSGNRIFYLEEEGKVKYDRSVSKGVFDEQKSGRGGSIVSADHCQKGTEITVYHIKICGGDNCLPQVFRDLNTILDDTVWKINQNYYNAFSEEELEEKIILGEGQVQLGLPVSSQYPEFETVSIDGQTTLENLLAEIYNFYNEYSLSLEDIQDYELTDELDEVLADLDEDKLVFRRSLLGNKLNFKGLKKDENIWIVILKRDEEELPDDDE